MGPADGGEEQYCGHHDAHHHDAHGPVPARYAHPRVRLVARRHRGYASCGGAESGVTGPVAVGVRRRRRSRPAAAAPPHPMVAKTKVVKPSRTMLLPIRSLMVPRRVKPPSASGGPPPPITATAMVV